MRAIRPTLSGLLLAVMLLVSEGIAVSLHWCCGAVESLAVFAAAQPSCCDEGSSTSSCTLDQRDECCQTATAYLLLPISSLRAGECPAVLNLSPAVLLPAVPPLSMAVTLLLDQTSLLAEGIQFHATLPLLQRFRL
ncbi:MAG: hypothetical protein AA908_06475 [Chlorobi bacterium NICIL-2]|jgi:hypothetical protein|nr:MAG: hypothetical protein AA908_06475 [Chlorobi bacterium NICIL-2]